MGGHGHSHGGGAHQCAHEHEPESDPNEGWSLWQYIDLENVTCLNEGSPGSGKNVFKSHDMRHDTEKFLESNDDDEQLILYIPFTGAVKITNICVVGGSEGSSPSVLKVWKNRDDVDFSSADDLDPLQQFDLVEDPSGEINYTTKIAKFQNITSLTMYFPENFGADMSRIYYIGLKGEFRSAKRQAVDVMYEAQAQRKDHKTEAEHGPVSRQIN